MQIRRIALWFVVVVLFALCASVLRSDSGTPVRSRILRLDPETGKPGDTITAYGEELDRTKVEELLLSNDECTSLVTIVQQNRVSIRFRIPAHLPGGRYTIIIQPAGRYARGIEQVVTLVVM